MKLNSCWFILPCCRCRTRGEDTDTIESIATEQLGPNSNRIEFNSNHFSTSPKLSLAGRLVSPCFAFLVGNSNGRSVRRRPSIGIIALPFNFWSRKARGRPAKKVDALCSRRILRRFEVTNVCEGDDAEQDDVVWKRENVFPSFHRPSATKTENAAGGRRTTERAVRTLEPKRAASGSYLPTSATNCVPSIHST